MYANNKFVVLKNCTTDDNIADVFTKGFCFCFFGFLLQTGIVIQDQTIF